MNIQSLESGRMLYDSLGYVPIKSVYLSVCNCFNIQVLFCCITSSFNVAVHAKNLLKLEGSSLVCEM